MDSISDLIEGLFSNLYIVIIIIAGIIGFFKNSAEKQKQEQRKAQHRQRQTAAPSTASRQQTRTTRAEQQQQQQNEPVPMKSIKEQQQEQMTQLANKYKTKTKQTAETASHKALIDNRARKPGQGQAHTQEQFKKQIRGNLGRKGLINSIVMAEVLGPPRAKKPYKSIINERRN